MQNRHSAVYIPFLGTARSLILVIVLLLDTTTAMLVLSQAATQQATSHHTIALGAYVDHVPYNASYLDQFRAQVGRNPAIVMWYQDWAGGYASLFDINRLNVATSRNAIPLITWEPWDYTKGRNQPNFSLRSIVNGSHDAFIRSWAQQAAAWGGRLYIRFAHEMNGTWYPWGIGVNGNAPAQYISAWRHVVNIFRQEKATNVRWVWTPSILLYKQKASLLKSYYPGDSYIDWVGLDGYNNGHSEWTSLFKVFSSSYQALAALTKKPMMLGEVASAEQGGNKGSWITQGFIQDIPKHFSRIRAVIWFDASGTRDWQINSSSRALSAFRQVARSSLYQGHLT